MKYRTLTDEELVHFEKDLKAFLIINGVDGSIWEKLNKDKPEQARALVDLFSDQVLQTIYERIYYLEHRSKQSLLVFQATETALNLIAIHAKDERVDLSTTESIHEALVNQISQLDFFQSHKKIDSDREMEVHKLLEQGAIPSSAEFWSKLRDFLNN